MTLSCRSKCGGGYRWVLRVTRGRAFAIAGEGQGPPLRGARPLLTRVTSLADLTVGLSRASGLFSDPNYPLWGFNRSPLQPCLPLLPLHSLLLHH